MSDVEEEEYEIEAIVDKQTKGGNLLYRVVRRSPLTCRRAHYTALPSTAPPPAPTSPVLARP